MTLIDIDIALVVVRLGIGCWLLWSVPRLRPATIEPSGRPRSGAASGSGVSVVVPARDEGATIAAVVGSIPDHADVVVVDDHSSDDTVARARAMGATVVPAGSLPAGWTGKAWACHRGVAATAGDIVVFVDADVVFAPGGFDAAVAAHRDHGGLVSVQPYHRPGSWIESLASIFNIVGFAGTDAASGLGRRRGVRGAFGPVLVTTRDDYRAIGGHDAVRASVVDDAALAARYRSAGLPVAILAGAEAVSSRMYPGGLGQLIDGFTKNMAAGAGAVRRSTTGLIVAWLSLMVQAAAAPVVATTTGDGGVAAVALYLLVATQYWWMARPLGRFGPVLALAFPISVALFLFVFARSAWATATGTLRWRGRRVPTPRG